MQNSATVPHREISFGGPRGAIMFIYFKREGEGSGKGRLPASREKIRNISKAQEVSRL